MSTAMAIRYRGICTAVALTMSVACSYSRLNVQSGRPLDEQAIKRIVIGQTTRSDVFNLLGTPHSMFQGQVEFREAQLLPLYLHNENRYLSSIDDVHYAVFYRFSKSLSTSTLVVVVSNSAVRIMSDELLLLLNRNTNVVDDVAYRKDTPVNK